MTLAYEPARTFVYGERADRPEPINQGLKRTPGLKLDEEEVKSIVQHELDAALGQDGGTLSAERLQAQRYFDGAALGTEVEGRSSFVAKTTLEAIEWTLPALLRIFTASDKLGLVEPPYPGLEQQAEQATSYLNHILYRDNPGFMILHDWFFDALLEKNGWVKYRWDTQQIVETKQYTGLTREQYDAIVGQDADVEIIKEEIYTQDIDEFYMDRPNPALVPIPLYDISLRVTRENGRVVIDNVAPEEVLFSRRSKRGHIPFLAHRRRWTISDLIQQGFDEDTLELVPADDSMEWNTERTERHHLDDDYPPYNRTDAGKEIWVEESYVQLSNNGKTTELYKVTTAGGGLIILTKDGKADIECVEEVPFVQITPIPKSHVLTGMSLADLTADLQLIKSTLIRQMLDNAYLSNWPRIEVADDATNENTYDDLLTLRPGGIVRTRRLGGIQPMMIPFTADKTFPLVQYIDQAAEQRTGVSPSTSIGADALNQTVNSTAQGMALAQNAAAQRIELFARIFAQGVEQLLRGVLGLVRRHQQSERIIRVTGGWLNVNPREWREEMPVTVSVGLGTGSREQILSHLMQIVQIQAQIVQQQGGVNGPLVYASNVYDTLSALTTNAGFKQQFFHDPKTPPPQGAQPSPQPQQDPAMMKAQMAAQAAQMKMQADVQMAQTKAQMEMTLATQKAALDERLAQQGQQHEMVLAERAATHRMELERQQSENDVAIARSQAEAQAAAQMLEIRLKAEAGAYNTQPGPNGAASS